MAGRTNFATDAEAVKASQPFSPRDDIETADQDTEDGEELLIAWLSPLLRTGAERKAGDVLPYCLVNQVGGTENIEEGTAAPLLSVHVFTARPLGRNNMKLQARAVHARMIRLGQHCDFITLTDGRQVGVDYVEVAEKMIDVDYQNDQILRKVGRYEIGLTYVPVG